MPSIIGADAGSGVNVAANYLKATSPFTQFGTRELKLISVSYTGADTTPTISNSLFSQGVRALQLVAEVYAVFAPAAGAFIAIVAADTVSDAQSNSGATANWTAVETAMAAGITGTPAVTVATLAVSGTTVS